MFVENKPRIHAKESSLIHLLPPPGRSLPPADFSAGPEGGTVTHQAKYRVDLIYFKITWNYAHFIPFALVVVMNDHVSRRK